MKTKKDIKISIIIPAKNEQESINKLYHEIKKIFKTLQESYEIIFIDDGSTDKTYEKMLAISKKDINIKIVKFRGNFGKSAALQTGFQKARGEIVFTMDADLQDDPVEIPRFLKKIDEGYDLVSGWKKRRNDPISKTLPSRVINTTTRFLTGVKIHDINCGFKAYKNGVVKDLKLYGELYRYIPIIVAKDNYKVGEISVKHRSRKFGRSKYGMGRFIKGFMDLITIIFLTGYFKRPAHFFGTLGFASFSGGFIIGLYITYLRITTGGIDSRHPLLYLGMLLMIIGVQLVSTGLLAEMIIHKNANKDTQRLILEEI